MAFRCNFPIKFSSTSAFTLFQIHNSLSTNYNRTDLLEYQFLGSLQYFNYLHNNFAETEGSVTHCFRNIVRMYLILLIIASLMKKKIISHSMALWIEMNMRLFVLLYCYLFCRKFLIKLRVTNYE